MIVYNINQLTTYDDMTHTHYIKHVDCLQYGLVGKTSHIDPFFTIKSNTAPNNESFKTENHTSNAITPYAVCAMCILHTVYNTHCTLIQCDDAVCYFCSNSND